MFINYLNKVKMDMIMLVELLIIVGPLSKHNTVKPNEHNKNMF